MLDHSTTLNATANASDFARHDSATEIDATSARLNWLVAALADEEERRYLFRSADEEAQMGLMRHPLSTRKAYALFGMLLGIYPPAAIFCRLFNSYGVGHAFDNQIGASLFWFSFCLAMNVICCLVGRKMGSVIGNYIDHLERVSWHRMIIVTMLSGLLWGATTGAIGGAIFFGIGAFFGIVCAVPVGVLAFTFFTLFHRPLTRGGMIEAAHFWPLAWGITLTIVALILSPYIFPY